MAAAKTLHSSGFSILTDIVALLRSNLQRIQLFVGKEEQLGVRPPS